MLKKALFAHLNASESVLLLPGIPEASSIPLTLLDIPGRVAYQSAIALKLAAFSHQDPSHLARQVVLALQTPQLPIAIAALLDPPPTAPQDRVSFIVADTVITQWLQALHRLPLPVEPNPVLPASVIPLLEPPWRLCQTLRLSLPLLLQWSQVRCGCWLNSWESTQARILPPPRQQERNPGEPETDDSSRPSDRPRDPVGDRHSPAGLECLTWSTSPVVSYDLLRALVYAVDTLAAQTDDAATYVRQGYAIAEALYTFEARLPISTLPTLELAAQPAIASLLQAVQLVLQLILLTVLGQTPVRAL